MRFLLIFCLSIFYLTMSDSTLSATSHFTADVNNPIRICGDGAEWPPFSYFKRINGKKTEEVVGYARDVLKKILGDKNIPYIIKLVPWKGCVAQTKKGKFFQMALDASYSDKRQRDFILTKPYYQLNGHYVYLKNRQTPKINTSGDLLNYRVCGLKGYNYEGFSGIPNENIDRGARTFPVVIDKLKLDRCDLFLARYEILAGFSLIGESYLNSELVSKPIPYAKPDKFHMMISRNYPNALKLKNTIDKGIDRLQANGELKRILNQYMP